MEIKFQGTMTKQDYLDAFKLFWRSGKRVWFRLALPVVFGLFFLVLAYLSNNRFLAIMGIVSVLLFSTLPQWNTILNWRRFKKYTGSYTGSADADWIKTHHSLINMELRWAVFKHVYANDKVLILCVSPMISRFIPRSFFASDADWNAFVELVKAKVPAR